MNIVQQPDVIQQTFSQAGVIPINTILMQIDCSRVRYLAWQCANIGASGVVTPEISLDGVNWVACTFVTPGGNTQATFIYLNIVTAAGEYAAVSVPFPQLNLNLAN